MTGSSHVVIKGSADLVLVERLLDAIEGLRGPDANVPEPDRALFMLAVSEIATNIATHNTGQVALGAELHAHPDELRAILRDTAPPVDIAWDTVELPDTDAESGRGLALARSVLDEFRHETDSRGNIWILVRRLHNPRE